MTAATLEKGPPLTWAPRPFWPGLCLSFAPFTCEPLWTFASFSMWCVLPLPSHINAPSSPGKSCSPFSHHLTFHLVWDVFSNLPSSGLEVFSWWISIAFDAYPFAATSVLQACGPTALEEPTITTSMITTVTTAAEASTSTTNAITIIASTTVTAAASSFYY